jgi:hypothetical protein
VLLDETDGGDDDDEGVGSAVILVAIAFFE